MQCIISKFDKHFYDYPHLLSFSCGTLKAADRDVWGLLAVAIVVPGCHHWGILVSPALATAQDHSWVYLRTQRDAGSPEVLNSSRSSAERDSGTLQSHLDHPHRAQLSSLPDQEGVVQNRFRPEEMTALQCQSLSVESQLFQRPHGETRSHSSSGTLFHPSKVSPWQGSMGNPLPPWSGSAYRPRPPSFLC